MNKRQHRGRGIGSKRRTFSSEENVEVNIGLIVLIDPAYPTLTGRGTCQSKNGLFSTKCHVLSGYIPALPRIHNLN